MFPPFHDLSLIDQVTDKEECTVDCTSLALTGNVLCNHTFAESKRIWAMLFGCNSTSPNVGFSPRTDGHKYKLGEDWVESSASERKLRLLVGIRLCVSQQYMRWQLRG